MYILFKDPGFALVLFSLLVSPTAGPGAKHESRLALERTASVSTGLTVQKRAQDEPAGGATSPALPAHAPLLTMFERPEDARYWISGQANAIFQGRIPFHSPYQGTNSFRNSAEYKTSIVETLYT